MSVTHPRRISVAGCFLACVNASWVWVLMVPRVGQMSFSSNVNVLGFDRFESYLRENQQEYGTGAEAG